MQRSKVFTCANASLSDGGVRMEVVACAEVVEWVRKILDPQCSAEERAVCHQRVEDLKERRNDSLVCGFQLACSVDPVIRHFGLQLLEHFVKYRWQNLHEIGRRDFSFQLLQHISSEAVYVKESLARLVVELAKKTWPQHWQTFLQDLDLLTQRGPVQVEVVLLVLRRLAEDLHPQSNASLSHLRRKEMSAALREQMAAVHQFIMQNLEVPVVPELRGVALSALTYYVEWLDWTDLLAHDCKLLRLLYSFISVEQLKTDACECLLAILSRKGDLKRTLKEREKLLVLLSKDALQVILDAALNAAACGVDEVQYVFIKRVCQVLVELGTSQIARLWESKSKPPDGFGFYLEVMLEFFKHDSQLVCLTATSLWSVFLTHSYIIDHPDFRRVLPLLFPEACKKLIRVGNPSSTSTDPVTQYNKLDFDDQNEYITFYSMYRNRLTIMLIKMFQKGAIPENAFDQTLELATSLTQRFPSEQCDRESVLYLEWDGFVAVMESWTNVMKSDHELRSQLKEKAISLARLVLNYDPRDALVLCCVLRCMNSGLLWVVDSDPSQLLQPYLQKIFSCIASLGKVETKTRKVMAAQNIAMQCFVKLCTQFGSLLLSYLPQLYEQYETAMKENIITYSMKSSFIEGFVILNLLRPDLEQQAVFLRQLMQEASTVLQELQQCGALSSLEGLVRYLGIHTSPEDPAFCPDHRAQLCYVCHVVSLVLKNSVVPSDRKPGQMMPASPEQHPSYQLTVPLLTQLVLPLIQLLHGLLSGKARHLTSSYFQHLYQLSVAEKEVIRGKVLSYSSSLAGQGEGTCQMQNSLVSTLEICLQSVTNAFSVFGCRHMLDIGFVDACIQTIFSSTAGLDCWKMRRVVRIPHLINFPFSILLHALGAGGGVTQPLVKLCPPDLWQSVLLPFLMQCCHTVFTKLRQSWEEIEEKKMSAGVSAEQIEGIMYGPGDEGEVSQEVIDEQFTIVLSRDYSSLIEAVCMSKKQEEGEKGREGERIEEGEAEEEMEEVKEGVAGGRGLGIRDKWMSSHEITPLALHLLSSGGAMCELLFISVFSGLSWGDTRCAHTFTNIAGLIIMKVSSGSLPDEVIGKLFEQVLFALRKHGIHEGNRMALTSLAQLMYETMVTQQPQSVTLLQEVLTQLPGNNMEKMKAFHNLLTGEESNVLCKRRRAKFRELVSVLCRGHISEVHKRPVVFDLPEIVFKRQAKEAAANEPVSLASLFGEDPTL